MRKNRVLHSGTQRWDLVPGLRTPFWERQIALGAQDSGGYTEGAEVSGRRNRRVGAGKLSDKRVPPSPPPPPPLSLGPLQTRYSCWLYCHRACVLRVLLPGSSSALLFGDDQGREPRGLASCLAIRHLSKHVWPVLAGGLRLFRSPFSYFSLFFLLFLPISKPLLILSPSYNQCEHLDIFPVHIHILKKPRQILLYVLYPVAFFKQELQHEHFLHH